jgi:hypothetical protein
VPRTRALTLAEAQKLLRELSPDRAAWVALMIVTSRCSSQRAAN